ALAAWAVLAVGLVGLVVKLASSSGSAPPADATALSPPAKSSEPVVPAPPESERTALPTTNAIPSAEPSPADDFSEELKKKKLGYLIVHSSAPQANVYVNLKLRGKVEEKLTVPCGNRFVSIGVPYGIRGEPSWLAPGKSMPIPCGGPLEMTMDPQA